MSDETASPFTSARIVGENVSGAEYGKNAERGSHEFVMSRSDLMEFAWCPSRWRAGYDDDGSKSTEWGSLMDCMLLDAEHFWDLFVIAPAQYPGKDKKGNEVMKDWTFRADYCKEWRAKQNGKTIITTEEYGKAKGALAVLMDKPWLLDLLRDSRRQVHVRGEYVDKATKLTIPVKGLIDIVPRRDSPDYGCMLDDFKTCASAGTRPWIKSVFQYYYHVQGAVYLDLWNAATGEDRNTFGHVLQENYSPWQAEPAMLSAEFVEMGRERYLRALKKYAACLASDNWPGYAGSDEENQILPGWRVICPEPYMVNQM